MLIHFLFVIILHFAQTIFNCWNGNTFWINIATLWYPINSDPIFGTCTPVKIKMIIQFIYDMNPIYRKVFWRSVYQQLWKLHKEHNVVSSIRLNLIKILGKKLIICNVWRLWIVAWVDKNTGKYKDEISESILNTIYTVHT